MPAARLPNTLPTTIPITQGEKDVLKLVYQGYSDQYIGILLSLSIRGVQHRLTTAANKLGVEDVPPRQYSLRSRIVYAAIQAGQLDVL